MATDQSIHDVLVTLITLIVVAYALNLLVRRLRRSRADLRIGGPVAAGFAIRLLAAAGVSQLSIASTLRGGDEVTFLTFANVTAGTPFGSSDWTSDLTGQLHVFNFALQRAVLDSPDFALRITQAGIAMAGLTLLAVAVYELAGARAGVIAAWLLAFEPTNIFFSTILHKEPNMMLASGLVALGGAKLWKGGDIRWLLPIAVGCLVGVATRPYAGWFLIAAGAAITLHAGLRAQHSASARPLALIAIVILFGAIAAPTVLEASTSENLHALQLSQNANAANEEANLSLEQVDFSSRGAIITNLPTRISDVLFRPYPWQLGSASQQFGLVGTTVFLALLAFLIPTLWRNSGSIMDRAGPLIYLGVFLLIAYSLSAGNAGTAFRYRTHIVAVGLCLLAALRFAEERSSKRVGAPDRAEPIYGPVGVGARS